MLDLTPLLRVYASRRRKTLDRQNAATVQQDQLLRLVREAANTAFGRDHDFEKINSVSAFQERVPIRTYDSFWADYWQHTFPVLEDCTWPGKIPYFAVSSGTTTGAKKYIPYSREMHKANGRAGLNVMAYHVLNQPNSHVLGGPSFMLGMSTGVTEIAPGVYCGDLGGIAASRISWWTRSRVLPSREVTQIDQWDKKVRFMADTVFDRDIRVIAGTPTWLLDFFDRFFTFHPQQEQRLRNFFPALELIVHGSINFGPYQAKFESLLDGTKAETREVYAASEGYLAAADRGPSDGLRLNTDHGLFFEFVPVAELGSSDPTRHWVHDAEPDVEYALVISSCAGLWAYVLGDTIKFLDREPPRIRVTGRTSFATSFFGQYFTSSELEEAVSKASRSIGAHIVDFTLGTLSTDNANHGARIVLFVEFSDPPSTPFDSMAFRARIDDHLCQASSRYRVGRVFKSAEIVSVERRTFENWMTERGYVQGQYKVPRILVDSDLFISLYEYCADS
jgi:hypothetical protein